MACYNCKNLDGKKKADGKVSGSLYYCKKAKKYVNPAFNHCDKFAKSDRKSWENEDIYKAGKEYYNDATPIWVYAFALLLLVIVGLFLGVFW